MFLGKTHNLSHSAFILGSIYADFTFTFTFYTLNLALHFNFSPLPILFSAQENNFEFISHLVFLDIEINSYSKLHQK